MAHPTLSRRSFLRLASAAALLPHALRAQSEAKPAAGAAPRKNVPIGIQMYSVKDEEKRDLPGTLAALKDMGYDGVEFWGPYFHWTAEQAREVRGHLDRLGLRCFSAHTRLPYWEPEHFPHAVELNKILGSRYIILDTPGKVEGGLDGWKRLAERLAKTAESLRPQGVRAGYHNYPMEWRPIDGTRPIDILTANTPDDFGFQLDTGTCLSAGADPVAFIRANPGRVKTFHLKDWSPEKEKGGRVLLGEGIGRWREIAEAAESVGGVEYYLIEQEGTGGRFTPMETAQKCLQNFKALRAAGSAGTA